MKFKKMTKRGASFFLALVMCVSLLQVPAYAAGDADNAEGTANTPDVNLTVVQVNNNNAASDTIPSAPEVTTPESTAPETAASEDNGEFDLSKTERPEQTDDITVAPGAPEDINTPENPDEPETPADPENPSEPSTPVTPENPSEPVTPAEPENPGESEESGNTEDSGNTNVPSTQDKNWDIFYNDKKGVYELTFNIDKDAEELHQVVDLTQALELLGQYAQVGKQELEQARAELEKQKPVEPTIGPAPTMSEITVPEPEEPKKPVVPDGPPEPTKPEIEQPVEPGKPEGLDEATQGVWDKVFDLFSSADGNKYNNTKNVLMELENAGVDPESQYAKDYAQYLVDKADNAFLLQVFETRGEVGGMSTFKYFVQFNSDYNGRGTPTDEQVAKAIATVQRNDANLKVPEYAVDKSSDEYKAYEAALSEYNRAFDEYEAKLAEYEAAQAQFEKEHGVDSLEYQNYLAEMEKYQQELDKYTAAKVQAAAEYAAAMAEYTTKLTNLQAKYNTDMEAYNAAVKELNEKYTNWVEADVLQPGDVLKFVIYLTSDSKHTYKYQEGSFTLATPGWGEQPGKVEGFDGQILPDEYVDNHKYHVTLTAKPMQDLFKSIGMLDPENPLNGNGIGAMFDGHGNINSYPSYWNYEINKFLNQYEGKDTAEKLNAYILDYYNSANDTEYTTIDALLKANPDARKELTKTITDGNKWFSINGVEKFVVDAHLETVSYDTFYQSLLSFAYGDDVTIADILGDFKIVDGRFEYDNDSWTSSGLKNALAYYMAHDEIWETTDNYFQQLLKNGLSKEEATWTSFIMALNIDGEMTGNDWQNTKWPWYNSIQLERMDIDFNLKKTDSETNETITSSETEFSVYYINTVKNADGTESKVNMYCTYDEATGSYTFVPDSTSTVWTKNGELNIDYAMMKDIVYYLQEMTAPEGYDRDTNVYIVMDEETYNGMTDEAKAQLGEFDKFLDTTKSEDGLTVNVQFVNSKSPTTPPPTPERPDRPTTPPPTDIPDPDVPLSPGPEPEEPPVTIDEPDVPLAGEPPITEIPEPDVPLAEQPPVTTIPEPEVPLSDVPMTGDASGLWYAVLGLAACGLVVLNLRKKEAL